MFMIKRFSIHLQAYPQNIILLSERVLLTTQMEGDAGQRLHSVTVDLVLVNNRNTGGGERGDDCRDFLQTNVYRGEPCLRVLQNSLHFHPAVLRWFSSARTQRRPGP